jgi:hypothetical protein
MCVSALGVMRASNAASLNALGADFCFFLSRRYVPLRTLNLQQQSKNTPAWTRNFRKVAGYLI